MNNSFAIALIAVLSLEVLHAQERTFTATPDRFDFVIGDQVMCVLELKSHSADSVSFPALSDTLIKEIEILHASGIDTVYDSLNLEHLTLRQTLTLTGFDSGYFAIAPLSARINDDTVSTNPLLFSVQTVPVDTANEIMDIRGQQEVAFPWIEWLKENWPWITLVLAVLIALVIVLRWWMRRKPEVKAEPLPPARPAHEIALEKIHELEQKKLWQNGHVKEHYTELTDILREYIEGRYQVPALEQTTDEIVSALRRHPDGTVEMVDKARKVLFLADLVKFAKENPLASENELNLQSVKSFVLETKVEELDRPKSNLHA